MQKSNDMEMANRMPKFKALDAVVILLVLVAVVGIYFRYNLMDTFLSRKDIRDYTVSFSVKDIRYTTPNYLNVGDAIYDASSGEQIGTLIEESDDMSNIALRVTPASQFFTKDDGTIAEVFYPNDESRVNANGRMSCRGSYTQDGGFLLNGSQYLSAGQTISVRTELVTFVLTITEIEPTV
ncbi:MAG: DUF4330 family protein [Clostridia bacterium]|nr:DUF4330 family protein [Clostridia bacterium]